MNRSILHRLLIRPTIAVAGTVLCLLLLLVLCAPETALALGTTAGTQIGFSVTLDYKIDTVPLRKTAYNVFTVDRAVDVVVTNRGDVTTPVIATNVAVPFLITNNTNTVMRYALSVVSQTSNTWDMSNLRIYLDVNANNSVDAGDILYADAGSFGDIAPDASIPILLVADTPAGLIVGQDCSYSLLATAVNAGTLTVSTETHGQNTSGVDTVFRDANGTASADGKNDGKHSAAGRFIIGITPAYLGLAKGVTVYDQWGGNQPIPGATLRYSIAATVGGEGAISGIVISDPLPQNTTYVPNSLKLNNIALTDALDADAGDVNGTTPGTVTVRLGSMTNASTTQTITFDVKIQ